MTRTWHNNPEDLLHKTVARYLDLALPEYTWWTTIPGGANLSVAQSGLLKSKGYKAGTPDVLILYMGGTYWLELKGPKGGTSIYQRVVAERLAALGSPVAVCRSLDDVEAALLAWGFALRITRMRRDLTVVTPP